MGLVLTDARLPVIADLPTDAPGLGFPEYAEALADAVRGGDPPQFTIGLYGAWGTGKSSLLKALAERLQVGNDVIPVVFDAWRYESSESIVVPLLHTIYRTVEASGNAPAAASVKRALEALVFSLNFKIMGFGVDTKSFRENWDAQLVPLDEAFARPFTELRDIPTTLGGKRLAVLVDDLDRCSPEKVVSVLEAINLIMDVPGFVFVLALDYDVLVNAIKTRYPHVSGHDFIQKIIQIPFRVPPLLADEPTFIRDLVPQWESVVTALGTDVTELVNSIAVLALDSNPRQVKRFVNSLLVINQVMTLKRMSADLETLAATIGLQLGWPEAAQDFQEALLAGDAAPVAVLNRDESEPELKAYVERFLTTVDVGRLRSTIQLTGIVATADIEEERSELPVGNRGEQLDRFLQSLWERGFRQSSRSTRLYYHPETPNIRFVVAKHVVRFEKKVDNDWRLWESYLMTRELPMALRVINEPDRHFSNRGAE
jgi:hypothetical protein